MNPKDAPFIDIMSRLSPGQSIVVPASAESSFILNLDSASSFDCEQDLRTPDSLRLIAHSLSSIASSLDDIISAWNGIDEDEEDEDMHVNAVDRYDAVHSDSMATIEELIKQLQADVEIDFDR
jgi:hypothetical protein